MVVDAQPAWNGTGLQGSEQSKPCCLRVSALPSTSLVLGNCPVERAGRSDASAVTSAIDRIATVEGNLRSWSCLNLPERMNELSDGVSGPFNVTREGRRGSSGLFVGTAQDTNPQPSCYERRPGALDKPTTMPMNDCLPSRSVCGTVNWCRAPE
jgi:hypothetical protein